MIPPGEPMRIYEAKALALGIVAAAAGVAAGLLAVVWWWSRP